MEKASAPGPGFQVDGAGAHPNNAQPAASQPPPYYGVASNQQPVFTVQPGVTTVIVAKAFGPDPIRMRCPTCHADVTTKIRYETGTMTHICAVLVCLLFWPCVCVPYCTDCTKDTIHECPNCDAYIGQYKR